MKKVLLIICINMIIISCFTGYALEKKWYQAVEVNQEIILNGEKQDFDSPVVKINDRIYVPLRESAEKLGIDVEWFGEDKDVFLDGYYEEVLDIKTKAEELWGFPLPPTAVFLGYDYFISEGDYILCAKISFKKEDFEYIRDNLLGIENMKWYEVKENQLFDDSFYHFFTSDYYSWWTNPTKENLLCAYQYVCRGKYVNSRYSNFCITEAEDGTNHLLIDFCKIEK